MSYQKSACYVVNYEDDLRSVYKLIKGKCDECRKRLDEHVLNKFVENRRQEQAYYHNWISQIVSIEVQQSFWYINTFSRKVLKSYIFRYRYSKIFCVMLTVFLPKFRLPNFLFCLSSFDNSFKQVHYSGILFLHIALAIFRNNLKIFLDCLAE